MRLKLFASFGSSDDNHTNADRGKSQLSMTFAAPIRRVLARVKNVDDADVMFFALAYAGSAALQKGLGFVLFLYFAHSMTIAEYARFGLLYALQAGVASLAMAGIIETTIGGLRLARSPAEQQLLLNSANLVQMATALLSLIIVALAFSWSMSFGWAALSIAATGGALTSFFGIQAQLSRIVGKHAVALVLGFAPQMLALFGGFIGFLVDRSTLGFFIGSSAGLLVSLPLARLTKIELPRLNDDRSKIKYIVANLGPFVLVAIGDWFAGYGNTYLSKLFFDTSTVARFVFAYTLSSIMHLVATSMNQAWSPRLFKAIHELQADQVNRQNKRFYMVQGVVLGLTGGVILILIPLLIGMSGKGLIVYKDNQFDVFILFVAYVITIPWYHAQNYYYAHARGPLLMRVSIASSLVGVLLWVGSATLLGPIGAYVGFLLMMGSKVAFGVARARLEWRIPVLWQGSAAGLLLLSLSLALSILLQR